MVTLMEGDRWASAINKSVRSFLVLESLIWNLPPSLIERLNERISNWQGKKNTK
jgi:hypothetical protein